MDDSRPATSDRGEPMRCPTDGSRLVEVERSDVLIDACPTCRGVWLDRGELDKILVREREMAAGGGADEDFLREAEGRRGSREPCSEGPSRGYGEHGGYEAGHRSGKRRRRGLLEDLLDFG